MCLVEPVAELAEAHSDRSHEMSSRIRRSSIVPVLRYQA